MHCPIIHILQLNFEQLLPVGLLAGAGWVETTRGSTRVTLRTGTRSLLRTANQGTSSQTVHFYEIFELNLNCPGVVIMGMEEADVTTTTSMTIGTGMGVQPTAGEGLAIGFGAEEAQSTIDLDRAR